jgi:meiotic recombination protein REC8, fungi type
MNSMNSVSVGDSFLDGFDLPRTQSSQVSMKPPGTAELLKLDNSMSVFDNDEEIQEYEDWGIEIDADGNLMSFVEEPELPKLPRDDDQVQDAPQEDDHNPILDNDGDAIVDFDGPALPDAEPFPPRKEVVEEDSQDIPEPEVAAAPIRKRRQRHALAPDAETTLSRKKIKAWGEDYMKNIERARNRARRKTTVAQAKSNAYNLIFGRGLTDVGIPIGRPNLALPLADFFAGDALETSILCITPRAGDKPPRRRRRTALEALELESEEEERRVRPRLSAEPQQAGQADDIFVGDDERGLRDDEEAIEVGRQSGKALAEIHSDVPWNRPSSQMPSSSAKGGRHGFGSSRQVSPSPLRAQGSQNFDIERYSDQPYFGSDDFEGSMHSGNNNSFDDGMKGDMPAPPQEARISQAMEEALGREGTNFLNYVQAAADEKGIPREDGKNWVEFDHLFERQDQTRAVATQAFYHTLTLATRGAIKVEQDGQNQYPFGTIRLGVQQPVRQMDEDDEI